MKTKLFTFYSYKGGSGRSTTLINTAKHLAEKLKVSKEHPILLVDADLESAGLTYFFHCENRFTARIPGCIHAEDFLNRPRILLEGVLGDGVFGEHKDFVGSCDNLAKRLSVLYPNIDCESIFEGVEIRETTKQILEKIIINAEEKIEEQDSEGEKTDNLTISSKYYLADTYELKTLLNGLYYIEESDACSVAESKRKLIENFLPTDGMVDISGCFGLEEGAVKFIGVDVAFDGNHSRINNMDAGKNKRVIVNEFTKRGFSAILFDCGAGVQNTAHILNHLSDVIVYCMRPTHQFISGTYTQLRNYSACLMKSVNKKAQIAEENGKITDQKSVILLPTAVPITTSNTNSFQKDSFERITNIASRYTAFVDSTFCSYENALREVSLFKWREIILGTQIVEKDNLSTESITALSLYSSCDTMPEDAKKAYNTYNLLADRLIYNA